MMEVPEGQIPRDDAFWRTYDAVSTEYAQAMALLQCSEEARDLVMGGWEQANGCQRCHTPLADALRERGFIEESDRWVKR
jgi:hypothetical protein